MTVRRLSTFGSPYAFWIASSSVRTSVQRPSSSLSRAAICRARLRFSSSSLRMIEDLEPRETIDLQLEDGVGLIRVELEPLHDLLGGVRLAVGLPDDADDFVERIEHLLEPLEEVDPLLQRGELVLQPLGDDLEPEMQEVPQNLLEIEPFGTADLGILGRDRGRSG